MSLGEKYNFNKDPAPTCEHYKCVLTIEHALNIIGNNIYCPNSQLSHILLHFQNVIFSTISLISTFYLNS